MFGFICNILRVATYKKKRDFIINFSGLKISKSVGIIYIMSVRIGTRIINLELIPLCGDGREVSNIVR